MRKLLAAAPLLLVWGCGPSSTAEQAPVSQTTQPTASGTPSTSSSVPVNSAPSTKPTATVVSNSVSHPIPNSNPKSKDVFLPMQDGNQWIYDADVTISVEGEPDQHVPLELTFKLTDVKHLGDATQATLAVYQGDVLVDKSVWEESSTAIRQLGSGLNATPFSHPEPVMNLPVTENQVMHWSNAGFMPNSKAGSQDGKTLVSKAAHVDTAVSTVAGVSSTVSSTYKSTDGPGEATTTTWFEPGVGIVRMVQTVVQEPKNKPKNTNLTTLRLKSWTLQQ